MKAARCCYMWVLERSESDENWNYAVRKTRREPQYRIQYDSAENSGSSLWAARRPVVLHVHAQPAHQPPQTTHHRDGVCVMGASASGSDPSTVVGRLGRLVGWLGVHVSATRRLAAQPPSCSLFFRLAD